MMGSRLGSLKLKPKNINTTRRYTCYLACLKMCYAKFYCAMLAGERKYQMSNEKCAASRRENFASNESARGLFSLALLAQLKIILCHTLYSECTFL